MPSAASAPPSSKANTTCTTSCGHPLRRRKSPARTKSRSRRAARIDLLCPGGIGIEIKRGQPDRKRIVMQLTRYAACGQISSLILVTERTVAVPNRIHGKPISCVCLNRLWGIAL